MKLFFLLALCLFVFVGSISAQNPTKLWELRDSLLSLEANGPYANEARVLLKEIQPINAYLSRVLVVIPTPNLRIDVIAYTCGEESATINDQLQARDYLSIAYDCAEPLPDSMPLPDVIQVANPRLQEFMSALEMDTDPRITAIQLLAQCVQAEIALLRMTFRLRELRRYIGDSLDGLLVADSYYVESHLKNILLLFKARSNLN